MRCFIAVDVDNPSIAPFIEELLGLGAGLKTVSPGNLHLTLKFLGEVSEDRIADIQKAMEQSLEGFGPFGATLHGTDAFPNAGYMRVVWIGMQENAGKLIEMQKAVDGGLSRLGFAPDKKFHPHLTVARVKSQKGKGRLAAFLEKNRERAFGNLMVESVRLKKSMLGPGGPTYSTIGEVKLEGAA